MRSNVCCCATLALRCKVSCGLFCMTLYISFCADEVMHTTGLVPTSIVSQGRGLHWSRSLHVTTKNRTLHSTTSVNLRKKVCYTLAVEHCRSDKFITSPCTVSRKRITLHCTARWKKYVPYKEPCVFLVPCYNSKDFVLRLLVQLGVYLAKCYTGLSYWERNSFTRMAPPA